MTPTRGGGGEPRSPHAGDEERLDDDALRIEFVASNIPDSWVPVLPDNPGPSNGV